jgi:hypothetical protein
MAIFTKVDGPDTGSSPHIHRALCSFVVGVPCQLPIKSHQPNGPLHVFHSTQLVSENAHTIFA